MTTTVTLSYSLVGNGAMLSIRMRRPRGNKVKIRANWNATSLREIEKQNSAAALGRCPKFNLLMGHESLAQHNSGPFGPLNMDFCRGDG